MLLFIGPMLGVFLILSYSNWVKASTDSRVGLVEIFLSVSSNKFMNIESVKDVVLPGKYYRNNADDSNS